MKYIGIVMCFMEMSVKAMDKIHSLAIVGRWEELMHKGKTENLQTNSSKVDLGIQRIFKLGCQVRGYTVKFSHFTEEKVEA